MTSQLPHFSRSRANLTISTDPELLDIEVVHHFLSEQSYWARGVGRGHVERAMEHSLCFGIYADNTGKMTQIGFARVVTDFTRFAYLADVFIVPESQGQGLGKWLVETILDHPELHTIRRWVLHTTDAHAFYRQLGFETGRDIEKYMAYVPPRRNNDDAIVEEH